MRALFISVIVLSLFGCTAFFIPPYYPPPINVGIMQSALGKMNKRLYVAGVYNHTKYPSGDDDHGIDCRAGGPISPSPTGITFSGYIKNALTNELKISGLYSDHASLPLKIVITNLNFNTLFSHAAWVISANVSIGNKTSFVVSERYSFDASFFGGEACPQVANAFVPAVSGFINKIMTNKSFKRALE